MSRWAIDVPDVPPSLNQVLRMHWTRKRRLKTLWMTQLYRLGAESLREIEMLASERTKMRVSIVLHNARQYDKDNAYGACKVIVDGMVGMSLVHDDRPEFLDLEVKQEKCKRIERHTTIELEVLGAPLREKEPKR